MSLPRVVSREEWLAARKELLAEEKALTRARDALNAQRRRLPMVEIDKDYAFEGPDGPATPARPLRGTPQLIVDHFMFDPDWDEGCPSCSGRVDQYGNLAHLHARDTTMAVVSRAPIAKIERFKAGKGWTFPWYSSYGSDFNYDFHVTLDDERGAGRVQLPRRARVGRGGARAAPARAPRHERLPARRRPGLPHVLDRTRAAPSRSAAPTTTWT